MTEFYKALFCGDRNWIRSAPIVARLNYLKRKHGDRLIIIEGEAPGADIMSRMLAHERSIHVAGVWALWSTRHRGAGPQRNEAMTGLEPDEVNAYHDDLRKSKGTKHMVSTALKLGIPVNLNNKPYLGH